MTRRPRPATVTVLCEDPQHEVFVRRLLHELGIGSHALQVDSSPLGRRDATQYIRTRYPLHVQSHRRRLAGTPSAMMIVVVDADKGTVDDRLRELDASLSAASIEGRRSGDNVAILVPRWRIETWIHHLLTYTPVDEAYRDYPKLKGRERDCQPAVERFVELMNGDDEARASCPPSMLRAFEELRRLFP